MSEQPFSLDLLYQTIEQHLQQSLGGIQLVSFWPDIKQHIPLPAVFLDIAEIEPGTDIGTGESTLSVTFEARVIVDVIRAGHYQQAIHLATQLAVLLRTQTWGLAVEPAEFKRSTQDWTRPELDGYTVWLVEWTQTIYLGETEWPWPDEPPGSLVFSVGGEVDP
ncbi:hypothetical protein CJF43_23285 [Pseudomonas fragi]|uniref:Phage protein n=2 Tax=Pseudomonas TaxID=286 RepID=A0A266LNX6_PSEFR|nr:MULTISPECIES: hypothetical protein [Pseudomonas]NNB06538.1 hypothetical protein [Pseudomonas fragi]NNB13199.1 hypothetical protein [Pseudomonas fragi]NNB31962.1 hypothetical protein [Pseudomonas fragi]OZY39350.1 hypothetical protein CJF43_23285 [Pseudomonas fragi]VVN50866.1 hypothetical protein PS685_00390 [Pseudomonas fluorescens]